MGRGLRFLTREGPHTPGAAWAALAALLAAGSLLAWMAPSEAWLWRRDAPAQVWRWWSGAFAHLDGLHLAANLAGVALIAALGAGARLPWQAAAAWAMAWPLTHIGLWLAGSPSRYGGLSGVLHAGVAVAASFMICGMQRHQRLLGIGIALGLAVKISIEAPWLAAVRPSTWWGFPVVVGAHCSGALAGVVTAMATVSFLRRRRGPA